ncbi:MAG: glycine betaine ABC transporter substrate-binding protein [Lacisediminihabitans sp.]
MNRKITVGVALAAVGLLLLSGCSTGGQSAQSGSEGSELAGLSGEIGSKDFAEQYILAYITTDILNAHGADLTANTKLVGSANTRAALTDKKFVGYWEYTGTAWITYLKNTAPITDPQKQFDAVKSADEANGIAWLDPAPLNNTYTFAVRSSEAKKLGVKTLSDVAKLPASDQTYCIESEFSTRDDGWPGVEAAYGITVPKDNVKLLDTGVIYTATQKGDPCNFGEVFATDGRIKALDLTVMKDDKNFFAVYQGALTLQAPILKKYPAIATIMAKVSPKLTTEEMQKLNAKVDVDGDEPATVAKQWLQEQGLIK